MAYLSLVKDLDSTIQNSAFHEGQMAVGYDKGSLYFDVDTGSEQKRVSITGGVLKNLKNEDLYYVWIGTQGEYEALTPRADTLYITTDGTDVARTKVYSTQTNNALTFYLDNDGTVTPLVRFALN